MVNIRIVSTFFPVGDGASPATITVSGVALIGVSTRKCTTVGKERMRTCTIFMMIMKLL